ncbi:MAG: GT4 family glycosyltransferase PelF [Anaerolineae bacterium]|nr:GT4 family glycosyltransferase PelF [Anaerolineae bacterium]
MADRPMALWVDGVASPDRVDDDVTRPLSVCLITEGSYPHYRGGVSTWCHMLISGLPEVRFSLVSLVADPSAEPVYDLPDNVIQLKTVPLWGTGEVLELQRHLSLREVLRHKLRTPQGTIESVFVPLFAEFMDLLWSPESDSERFAGVLQEMAAYFTRFDYDVTLKSAPVWQTFLETSARGYERVEGRGSFQAEVSLLDVTNTLRLLYRWLTVLTLQLPEVDVIHAASGGLCSMPAIAAANRRDTAFLLTEHGIYLRERLLALSRSDAGWFEQVLQAAFAQKVTQASYAVADQIAPGSNYNHRWQLYNGALAHSIQTIYNGPDPSEFTPARHNKPLGESPTITWLGRIDPLKDLETLIRAAAIVVKEVPDVRFVLYGKAPRGNEWYQERCLALRDDLGLQQNVIFGGFAASAAAAYNEGDFVVLSSISEGFPYSVVEAMMCGRTVVGTDVGGVSEALDGVGIVVEPRNPEELAAGMLQLLRDPLLAQVWGEQARARALERFSLQQCNAAYLSLYQRLVTETAQRTTEPSPLNSWGVLCREGLYESV